MKKKTKYVILGLLRDEPMSGYDIKYCINMRMSYFWQESYGQIYPALNEMLSEGLITECSSQQTDGRGKTTYSITEKGSREFNSWMAADNEKDTVRSEALLKFFLADDQNRMDIKHHLEDFYSMNTERLSLYRKLKQYLGDNSDHSNHKYILKMLELGIKQQELYCNWSKDYLDELKGMDEK